MLLNDNFWKWFGNSKLKDRNGNPIPFYHTSYMNFDVFQPTVVKNKIHVPDYENGRQHFYFAKNKDYAKQFGRDEFPKKKKHLYEVFLKVENPLVVRDYWYRVEEWVDFFQSKGIELTKDDLNKTRLLTHISKNNIWHLIFKDKHMIKDAFKKAGYDGIIYADQKRWKADYSGTYPNLAICVFDSNQIKSVNNNGNWSLESDNINESVKNTGYKMIKEEFDLTNTKQSVLNQIVQKIYEELEKNYYIDEQCDNYFEYMDKPIPNNVLQLIAQDLHQTNDIDELRVAEILCHPYSEKYVKEQILKEIRSTYQHIKSLGNEFKLYRFISLEPENLTNGNLEQNYEQALKNILSKANHLGVCWALSYSDAKEFANNNFSITDGIILEITASQQAIDYPTTLVLRSPFTELNYENEIRLIKGSKIILNNVYAYFRDNPDPIIINKPYKA